jgi:hypothetical protein
MLYLMAYDLHSPMYTTVQAAVGHANLMAGPKFARIFVQPRLGARDLPGD